MDSSFEVTKGLKSARLYLDHDLLVNEGMERKNGGFPERKTPV